MKAEFIGSATPKDPGEQKTPKVPKIPRHLRPKVPHGWKNRQSIAKEEIYSFYVVVKARENDVDAKLFRTWRDARAYVGKMMVDWSSRGYDVKVNGTDATAMSGPDNPVKDVIRYRILKKEPI